MQPGDRLPCSESPDPVGPGEHDEIRVPSRDAGTQSGTLEGVVTLHWETSMPALPATAVGTQPLAERGTGRTALCPRDLEPGTAQRAAPNLTSTFTQEVPPGSSRGRTRHKVRPPPWPPWWVSFAANSCFRNAEDMKYEDRNCRRLLIWVLPISLFQILIFHKDESPLPALSDRHYLGVLPTPRVEICFIKCQSSLMRRGRKINCLLIS